MILLSIWTFVANSIDFFKKFLRKLGIHQGNSLLIRHFRGSIIYTYILTNEYNLTKYNLKILLKFNFNITILTISTSRISCWFQKSQWEKITKKNVVWFYTWKDLYSHLYNEFVCLLKNIVVQVHILRFIIDKFNSSTN